MAENGKIRRGIDFDLTTFTDGAMRLNGNGPNSGIMFDGGNGGEVFSNATETGPCLNVRIGKSGLRVWDSEGQRVLLEITDAGVRIVEPVET